MAKRRKLEAPSSDDLERFEAEFRRETPPRMPLAAPISQIAADSARAHDPRSAAERAEAARDRADAERFRNADMQGLILQDIPLDAIEADAIVRDRLVLDAEDMAELQQSIATQGMRLPIEVFRTENPQKPYGLISGYRRLRAVQNLRAMRGQGGFDTIKAIIRDPDAMGGPFVAMVEENEVRAGLSHFERGRIAVIAAQQGAFPNVEAAVDALFASASRAKRSKVRSFALIFEELGDMLMFPDALREKEGLKLAAALRDGHEAALREALAQGVIDSPQDELMRLEEVLGDLGPAPVRPERGGRPPRAAGKMRGRRAVLDTGIALTSVHDGKGWTIRLDGQRVDAELVEVAMRELERLLGPY
ncbi:ParB/RepB/Spo0J family partition protein [Falsirhodobacter algicola]|uniref:ParB N-terminal domain-containing protein n=1 Tax=Falsirhodobacter algicola TaxID=2692330 RepID=A0A8J8MUQ6_9RHOB|nr:ParB/RepB/Spo0J family partition protein [Falsirhodobacter algicola]QUS37066.1 ParB N-terminal domain-containing protein [Falsirhodobacter algicola]